MAIFYVNKNLTTSRVVLSDKPSNTETETMIQEVIGDTWIEAREALRVDHVETYTHHYGHGYFDI